MINQKTNVVEHSPKGIMADTTEELLASIISLKDDTRFNAFIEWLNASKERCDKNLLWTVTEPNKTIIQGNDQVITTILITISDSLDKVKEFRINQNERI